MYRLFFIAKNNIKKQKKDMITFFIMTMITSFLVFLSLSYMTDIGGVIDHVYDKVHGADIILAVSTDRIAREKTQEVIQGNPYVAEYESAERLYNETVKYGHRGDRELTEYPFTILSYDTEIRIHKVSMDTKGLSGNEAVLPIRMSPDYAVGDVLRLKFGDNIYDLTVAGYAEDPIYCSPMNMGSFLIYVSDSVFQDILFENAQTIVHEDYHKIRLTRDVIRKNLDTNELCDEIFNEINDWITEYKVTHPDYIGGIRSAVPYAMLHGSAMILPLMFIAMVFVFALIIFIIAMVIIHFSVKNFIITNMKNTAIMEAAGYTVRELVLILLVQLVSVALFGGFIGVAAGALSISRLSVIILMTLGLPWNQPVNMTVFVFTLLGLCGIVGMLTLVIGRDYSRTSVLEALRGGINAHNFKKNYFPFEKSVFPVAVTLSFKETFGRFRSHLGVLFIVMLLSASVLLGFGTADTFSDDDAVVNMAGMDYADVYVAGNEQMGDALKSMVSLDYSYGEVWETLNFTSRKVRKEWSCNCKCYNDTSRIKGLAVIDGRMPVHPNEIMFATNAANKLKVGVGDTVTVRRGGREESYLISGLCQVINNLGMMSYMTTEGLERIAEAPETLAFYGFLKKGFTLADFEKEFAEMYPDAEVANFRETVQGVIGIVQLGIKAVALVIAILTALVVAFVESLIIRTQITRTWRNLGVSKALGYTSGQLILQAMLSNMPAVVLGMIPGMILASVFGERIMTLMFSIFGFKKSEFFINPSSYLLSIAMIAGIAMVTAALAGRKIRRLEPVKMITEE
ncbi:MAG: ABC transporter permease [Lachnospiraceae bacterium]|nr:ABC transporter permease [Lachnospiraceae bacterium]